MIEVLVRLGGEEPQREMLVRAGSITDALCIAEEHGLDGVVSVVFPIDADRFFVPESVDSAGFGGRKEAPA